MFGARMARFAALTLVGVLLTGCADGAGTAAPPPSSLAVTTQPEATEPPATRPAVPTSEPATDTGGPESPADQGPSGPDEGSQDPAPSSPVEPPSSAPIGANVIGTAGIAAWDALPDQGAILELPTLYLHQSVGQDLEDGAADAGQKFEYYGPGTAKDSIPNGLNGGLFVDVGPVDNGVPLGKMEVVRREFQNQQGALKVMTFSFGYADVLDSLDENGRTVTVEDTFAEYQKLVAEVKAAGVAFVHITPPLVFDPSTNEPKMRLRQMMLDAFPDDYIFDLTDLESLDGGQRCETGGVWFICQSNRSSEGCPSKSQGVDTDGQGHLCPTRAQEFAKAFLYAIHSAGS